MGSPDLNPSLVSMFMLLHLVELYAHCYESFFGRNITHLAYFLLGGKEATLLVEVGRCGYWWLVKARISKL